MRYLPLGDADRRAMLDVIGVDSVQALFADVPEEAWKTARFDLPDHADEMTVARTLTRLAAKNRPAGEVASFLGAGAYRHFIPSAVDHLIQRGEFLTSYTPYQPEISQGTLQYLFEFQTQVAMLTGMEIANASLYDGASAAAEAVLMARRLTRRSRVVLSGGLHPHWAGAIRTLLRYSDAVVDQGSADLQGAAPLPPIDGETACVVVQYPDAFGTLADHRALAQACHEAGALLIVAVAEPLALGLVTSPGEMGADIVVGEGQGLGVGLNFGGPYLGLFATRLGFVRQMPGRIAGETVDAAGRRGYVLTLSTREQHIRREKATSNICTNSGLCALAFTIHMALLGDVGLRRLAALNHARAAALAERLAALPGVVLETGAFFNEFTLRLPVEAHPLVDRLAAEGIHAGVPASRLWPGQGLEKVLIVCITEANAEGDEDRLCEALRKALS